MTTCGMLGVNMAGPVADPMKNSAKGYRKPTRSSVLKASIRRKLR